MSHLQKELMEIIYGADKSNPWSGAEVRGPGFAGKGDASADRRDFNAARPRSSTGPADQRTTDYGPADYDAVSPGFSTSTSTPAGSTRCLRRSGVPVSSGNVP